MSLDPALEGFNGLIRLFPLPNLVLYPNVIQGLHLFEPRYRQLAHDSIGSDGLFALAVLKPGWEEDYEGTPALEPIACLGHIIHHEKIPDGRYNMRLRGVSRVRIVNEVKTRTPYRIARAELLLDEKPDDVAALTALRKKLAVAVLSRFESGSDTYRQLSELFHSEAPLGQVSDLLSYALPLAFELKYQLLAEPRVAERVEILTHAMTPIRTAPRKFPPEFSIN
jgi:Lon protease-like protein